MNRGVKIAIITLLLFSFMSFLNKPNDEFVIRKIYRVNQRKSEQCVYSFRKLNFIVFDYWKNDCGDSYYSFWGDIH